LFILQSAREEKLDPATVEEIAGEYFAAGARWGERMEQKVRLNAGITLARSRYIPELAMKILKEIESGLSDDSPEDLKADVRQELLILTIATGSDDQKKGAAETLAELQKQRPFDHRIAAALAEYSEQAGQIDQAIEQNARLSVLPALEQFVVQDSVFQDTSKLMPSENVARLWKTQRGSTDGLDAYLAQVYENTIYSFATKAPPAPPAGPHRTALVELMTGAGCPPCVAADVAVGGLQVTYPASDVIALRYHQHVNGPNPLTNVATEARFDYYGLRVTPSVLVNGKSVTGCGGPLESAPADYETLRGKVDEILAQKSDINLKLSATAGKGELAISAESEGPRFQSGNLRLRLILAEDRVAFLAPNGIRVHEMVVRDMPAGAAGITATNGRFVFKKVLSLADVKQQLVDYLANFERGNSIEFNAKPLELSRLHLVAFVQDDNNKEVLQAAAVPVAGILEYPQDPNAATRTSLSVPARVPGKGNTSSAPGLAPPPPTE
jgi:hypothetical protein